LLAIFIPFFKGMATEHPSSPKYRVIISLVIAALCPFEANLRIENKHQLKPGMYMHPCNSAAKALPLLSTIDFLTLPVVEHLIIWPSATSTPKF